tara:strand:+ start:59 stop:379 length:321 start_codon:yes stop_codon:yes gene_type:complete
MIKDKLKIIWFNAEDKTVEWSKTDLFAGLSKLLHTFVLLVLTITFFVVYSIIETFVFLKDKLNKENKDVVTQTIAPDSNIKYEDIDGISEKPKKPEDKLDKIRRHM